MLSFSIWKYLHLTFPEQIQNKTTPPPPNGNMTSRNDFRKLSFAEISPGGHNSVQLANKDFFAIDLAVFLTEKSRGESSKALIEIKERDFASSKFYKTSLGKAGYGQVKLITPEDSLELVKVFPKKMSEERRTQVKNIIQRYINGDPSVVIEPSNNAQSGAAEQKTQSEKHAPASDLIVSVCPEESEFTTMVEFENALGEFFAQPEVRQIEDKIKALEDKWHNESAVAKASATRFGKTVHGYVYALSNPFFPGMLKIGATFRTPEIRARELSGTGTPEPFVVVAQLKCVDPFFTEREVHRHFAEVRTYGKRKEFFSLSEDSVREYFETMIEKAMMHSYTERTKHIAKRFKSMKKEQHGAKKTKEEKKEQNPPQASAPDSVDHAGSSDTTSTESENTSAPIITAVPVGLDEDHVSLSDIDRAILKLISSVHDVVDISAMKEKVTWLLDTQQRMIENRKNLMELEKKESSGKTKKRALEEDDSH